MYQKHFGSDKQMSMFLRDKSALDQLHKSTAINSHAELVSGLQLLLMMFCSSPRRPSQRYVTEPFCLIHAAIAAQVLTAYRESKHGCVFVCMIKISKRGEVQPSFTWLTE